MCFIEIIILWYLSVYIPFRSQFRGVGKKVELLRPRGKASRNEIVPIQFQENIPAIQAELKSNLLYENCCKSYLIKILYSIIVEDTSIQTEKLKHLDCFNVHNLFTVADLFNARVHYAHREGTLDERMKPYIYGKRMGHIIFDLDKTAKYLRNALNFVAHIAYRDGVILFISRDPKLTWLVEKTAEECSETSQSRQWIQGFFTNSKQTTDSMMRLPDLCIFLNTLNDALSPHTAIKESAKMLIPTVGIVDSNCNPNLITYPVPGNDDSLESTEFYCRVFKEAILRGKEQRQKDINEALKGKTKSTDFESDDFDKMLERGI